MSGSSWGVRGIFLGGMADVVVKLAFMLWCILKEVCTSQHYIAVFVYTWQMMRWLLLVGVVFLGVRWTFLVVVKLSRDGVDDHWVAWRKKWTIWGCCGLVNLVVV